MVPACFSLLPVQVTLWHEVAQVPFLPVHVNKTLCIWLSQGPFLPVCVNKTLGIWLSQGPFLPVCVYKTLCIWLSQGPFLPVCANKTRSFCSLRVSCVSHQKADEDASNKERGFHPQRSLGQPYRRNRSSQQDWRQQQR